MSSAFVLEETGTEAAMDSATPMVCWFQECNKDSVDLVGGKCS
jgi:pyruvate,water dikinase